MKLSTLYSYSRSEAECITPSEYDDIVDAHNKLVDLVTDLQEKISTLENKLKSVATEVLRYHGRC